MPYRLTASSQKCYQCDSPYKEIKFQSMIKCCPQACLSNCTQKIRYTAATGCADCPADQVWDDDTNKCVPNCNSGLLAFGICFKIPGGKYKEEMYYDDQIGEIQQRSCPSGQFIQDGQCVNSCIPGTLADSRIICIKCQITNCLECQTATTCKTCAQKFFISTGQCLPCDPNCKTCQSTASNCLTCELNTYFKENTTSCVSCDITQANYLDNNNVCRQCDASCLSCQGSKGNCPQCASGKYKNQSTNQCVDCNNEFGRFVDLQDNTCKQCSSSCKTCKYQSDNCIICADTFSFIEDSNKCGKCDVANRYFIEQTTNKCYPCSQNFQSCNGKNPNNCLTCQPNKYKYF